MELLNPLINVYPMNGVLDAHVGSPSTPEVPFRLLVHRGDESRVAGTWCAPPAIDTSRVRKASFALLESAIDADTPWLVADIRDQPDMDVFDFIPDTFDVVYDTVHQLREVISAIQTAPLKTFLSDAFTLSKLYHNFWTCPASQAHHHAFRGGLAVHSIEMAERVIETSRLSTTDRDLAIAYALLHDIGKLECYGEDGYTHLQQLGHELVGLTQLSAALDALYITWPDGSVALRSLLSGLWKTKGARPILAVGKLVQAYDQASAEADLRDRKGHRYQPWQAQPWNENVSEFRARR